MCRFAIVKNKATQANKKKQNIYEDKEVFIYSLFDVSNVNE